PGRDLPRSGRTFGSIAGDDQRPAHPGPRPAARPPQSLSELTMNCEQAIYLISAQLDREIQPEERALLEHHLQDCPCCRGTGEAFALQDHEWEHPFEPRRQAVAATVAQVAASLGSAPSSPRPRRLLNWRPFLVLGGMAALFGLVFLFA